MAKKKTIRKKKAPRAARAASTETSTQRDGLTVREHLAAFKEAAPKATAFVYVALSSDGITLGRFGSRSDYNRMMSTVALEDMREMLGN